MTLEENKERRWHLVSEMEGAIADVINHHSRETGEYLAIVRALANSNPVMEMVVPSTCALCDTSEHYRHWPRHKDHCPWQQAKDLIESEEWG